MSAVVIDGRKLSAEVEESLLSRVETLKTKGIVPCLQVILAGEDPASMVYVANKEKACARIGIDSRMTRLPETVTQEELETVIRSANDDPAVTGVLVQLPLPKHLDSTAALKLISPEKDVDGFHDVSIGRLAKNLPCMGACTPRGIMHILHSVDYPVSGAEAVVVGRSNIVGKPVAMMLLNENATVTVCHSRTRNLAEVTRRADILVVSVGSPALIKGDMIKPGAIVIDVGINRVNGKLCGDVDFEQACQVAGYITPVPGGVGKMTIAMLMENTVIAAERMARD